MHQVSAPSTAQSASDDLLDAARAFFPDLTEAEAIAGHPDIARVMTPAGPRRIHRWPEGAAASDIAFSREVMTAASAAGMTVVPELVAPPDASQDPAQRLGARFYDAQVWLPGAPPARAEAAWPDPADRIDIPVTLSLSLFSDVMAAAARLHNATADLAERRDAPAAPLALFPGVVRQAHERHFRALRGRARREPAIQRWLAIGERLLVNAEPVVLTATEDRTLPECALHLGLWPAHILHKGDALAGLLGWELVAVGSPLVDIAQATLRLQGWSDETVEAAIATYADVRPLSPDERRLLPAVAALDAVATTGRLLEQTFAVAETARPPTALRSAIDMMLRSMTALDRSLVAQAAVGKSKRTPWRRGPRPAPRREGGSSRERRR